MITTDTIKAMFAAAQSVFSGAAVVMRHDNREITGIRAALNTAQEIAMMGARESASGAARFSVADFGRNHPKPGDTIAVKDQAGGDWLTRVIVDVRYDQMRATAYLSYGERYG